MNAFIKSALPVLAALIVYDVAVKPVVNQAISRA